MENISLVSDVDKMNQSEDSVLFMTLHSAKGLEFPYVFVAGMEDGLLPHANSRQSQEDLEEERRLCYVGITRGMKKVYLTHASSRRLYGRSERTFPSRFLKEIPANFIEELSFRGVSAGSERIALNMSDFGKTHELETFFEPGDSVVHRSFGIGVVLEVDGEGDRARVTVDFQNIGKKIMVQQYARLQKV
jgi:DNA helicase-2/ATP-dependent DNA helicase PcrA